VLRVRWLVQRAFLPDVAPASGVATESIAVPEYTRTGRLDQATDSDIPEYDASGQVTLEGDNYDADATSTQTVNFSVSAPPVVEGHSGNITVTAPIGTLLEWWTEDYSADGLYYINATEGQVRMCAASFSVQRAPPKNAKCEPPGT